MFLKKIIQAKISSGIKVDANLEYKNLNVKLDWRY